jgi:hypothetical protein
VHSGAFGRSIGFPQHSLDVGDQYWRWNPEYLRDFQKHHQIWCLNAALNQAYEGPIKAGRFRQIFLREFLCLPSVA